MEIRVVRYFLTICELGTMHAAADELHVAQPSLSRQIRRLEAELGFTLFERAARGLTLTPAGHTFRPVAAELVQRADHAATTARAIARGSSGGLTLAAAPTTVTDIVAPFVATEPGGAAVIDVVESATEGLYALVERGEADVAIGTRVPPSTMESVVIGSAFLWAQVPIEHELSGSQGVPLPRLLQEPLIVMAEGHAVRRMFEAALTRAGLTYSPAFETGSPATAQALAASGRGVCILSDDPRFELAAVPILDHRRTMTITLYGVWQHGHFAADEIREVVSGVGDFVARLYPQAAQPPAP
ncbi:LysR family transcriptional regulator [Agrococcus sp. ProA11]|uniref:LysR family transcriptional regulator n=1 Tax=Agrococcus chionoecetis TaxID=3153752 RepID=UPI003261BF8A